MIPMHMVKNLWQNLMTFGIKCKNHLMRCNAATLNLVRVCTCLVPLLVDCWIEYHHLHAWVVIAFGVIIRLSHSSL